jgi:hypothetical protein
MYVHMNAWREILARIFVEFKGQDNVSPEWLVNPATRRRLKLDLYYPDAGVAIRFVGLTAKGQGRQSDWEVLETEQRDQTRAELCHLHGVQLVLIDAEEDAAKQVDGLVRTLARASRTLAQGERSAGEKQKWMPALSSARTTASQLHQLIAKNPEQMMANLAESWRDREAGFATTSVAVVPTPQRTPARSGGAGNFAVGQRVRHERFGDGVITGVNPDGTDLMLSILFDGAQERTFLSSLVQGKLEIV